MKNAITRSAVKKAMLESDVYTDTLDAALTAAEEYLQKLLPGFPPRQIACVFSEHVLTHATEELANIAKHGHRNDDPADVPSPSTDTFGEIADHFSSRDGARAGLIPSEETDDSRKVHLQVTNREWDTMLAALRLWQKDAAHIADSDGAIVDLACEHGDALSNEEVDALVLRLNCSPDSGTPDLITACQTVYDYLSNLQDPDEDSSFHITVLGDALGKPRK